MTVRPIPAFTDNYIWLLIDESQRIFDCVDPGDAEPVLLYANANQMNLRSILLTHHHQDHIGGVQELIKAYPHCTVYGPNDPRIPLVTQAVKENELIHIGSNDFKILFNPGHTSTHISYYEPNQGWLFCGDTLFSAGCGRVFDGTIEELHCSIELFKSLPKTTKVFCAHEYTLQNLRFAETVEPENKQIKESLHHIIQNTQACTLPSTIEMEQSINPFFRTDFPAVIQFAQANGSPTTDSLAVFQTLRNSKNSFK